MNRSTPALPVHHQLPEFTQTQVNRVSDATQPSHPLSSPSPPALNPFQHQSFSNESTLPMRWPKYWSFSFSICPSNEHPGLISFRMDWLDLLAVQGTLLCVCVCFNFKIFNSYMIVYMLECHSPKSSHPLPLPLSPKLRYTHLCLFCCLAYLTDFFAIS